MQSTNGNKRVTHRPLKISCRKRPRLSEGVTVQHFWAIIHSFRGYLYSAPSRNLLRGALSPATAKEKCHKKLAERRHAVLGQQAQCKRESSRLYSHYAIYADSSNIQRHLYI